MTRQEQWGRKARRARREQARALAKDLEHREHSKARWGFILTYWGTLASILGLAVATLPRVILSSTLFAVALLQLIFGLWLWTGLSNKSKVMVTVLGGLLFTFLDWRWIVLNPRITVTPSAVTFDAPTTGDSYVFVAKNNTDQDLYTVGLRFRIEPDSLSANDFRFTIPHNSLRLAENTQMGDVVGLYCRNRRNGRPDILVWIFHLSAQESRSFAIKRIKLQRAKMQADIAYVSTDPTPIVFNTPTTSFHFGPPHWIDKEGDECKEWTITTSEGDWYSGGGGSPSQIYPPAPNH